MRTYALWGRSKLILVFVAVLLMVRVPRKCHLYCFCWWSQLRHKGSEIPSIVLFNRFLKSLICELFCQFLCRIKSPIQMLGSLSPFPSITRCNVVVPSSKLYVDYAMIMSVELSECFAIILPPCQCLFCAVTLEAIVILTAVKGIQQCQCFWTSYACVVID